MIYKVLYQEDPLEIPVREHTKSMYVRANSIREVREIVKPKNINIEFIQLVEDNHLDFEKENPAFKVENDES
ncbi:DNA-dependent RNA polymerase subunit epsilon [Gracilibacillus marinus]|uniref:DNA-directed RNA polymerase subunit epsilon n=1 Tax=Gracilibacillus marinus TaxID=630535 RepID=A0ABV8VUN7_9BACI